MLDSKILSQFACAGCGACCRWGGSVLLTDADIELMAEHLKIPVQGFIDDHTRLAPNRIQLALLDQPNGSCAFLDTNGRCSVYAARPEQCRTFPYAWSAAGCPELDKLLAEDKKD